MKGGMEEGGRDEMRKRGREGEGKGGREEGREGERKEEGREK